MRRLRRFFEIDERGSDIRVEIVAGISTFLSLSYIFVVNPTILSQAGMDPEAVLFATIVASGVATLAMGLWARLPFVLAPGMEMNAYVAFFVVGTMGLSWQSALGAVFWSGVLFLVLTAARIRQRVIAAIPDHMKQALAASVGVFLILVALKVAGILEYDGVHLRGIGGVTGPSALVFAGGLVVAVVLHRLRVKAAVLISIVAMTFLCRVAGLRDELATGFTMGKGALSAVGALNLGVLFDPRAIPAILVLFVVDFFGSVAKLIGLLITTGLVKEGVPPRFRQALTIDGLAAMVGAGLGTSSVTVYVESGVGIGSGGRTGLMATVCALLMLACAALAPLIHAVPLAATTGALAFVGIQVIPPLAQVRQQRRLDIALLVVMLLVVTATFAIDRAMLAGFLILLTEDAVRRRVPSPAVLACAGLLTMTTFLQVWAR